MHLLTFSRPLQCLSPKSTKSSVFCFTLAFQAQLGQVTPADCRYNLPTRQKEYRFDETVTMPETTDSLTETPANEPVTMLFQSSPLGNLDAIVQHDSRTVYFYLNENPNSILGKPKFGTRACWVQNLTSGPLVFDQAEMQQGLPVLLPRTHTRNREGEALPDADRLAVVWFEEGNGAALILLGDQHQIEKVLAVIPPWSGQEGFHGYSTECAVENEVCWPMPPHEALTTRINRADEFWSGFQNANNPFVVLQTSQLQYYRQRFLELETASAIGDKPTNESYFSIDGGKFPPRGLVQYDLDDSIVIATVGMSLLPLPMVELATEQPSRLRRVELAVRLPKQVADETVLTNARNNLSQLVGYPWRNFTWIGAGHTCNFSNVREGCENAVLVHDDLVRASEKQPLADFRDDSVNLLWLVPVDQKEQQALTQEPMNRARLETVGWRL